LVSADIPKRVVTDKTSLREAFRGHLMDFLLGLIEGKTVVLDNLYILKVFL
jgi:hypothetical protein